MYITGTASLDRFRQVMYIAGTASLDRFRQVMLHNRYCKLRQVTPDTQQTNWKTTYTSVLYIEENHLLLVHRTLVHRQNSVGMYVFS